MQKSLVSIGSNFVDLSLQPQTLKERLASITIEPAEADAEVMRTGNRIIRDKLAGLFKITDLINTCLTFNEQRDKALKVIKQEKLFEAFFNLSQYN